MMALAGCSSKAASIVGIWESDDVGIITFTSDGKWMIDDSDDDDEYGEYEEDDFQDKEIIIFKKIE